jgi:PAS domain S-box-containing protein
MSNEEFSPKRSLRDPNRHSAARIAGTYLLAGIVWIALSDFSLAYFGGLTSAGFLIAGGKGLLFVLLSSGLVFELCRREYHNSARTMGLLRAVVEGTTDAVFVKDDKGRYQLANRAAADFMGRSVEDVLGRDDRELFGAIDGEKLMTNDRAVIASGGVVTQDERLTSGGVTRTYHATKAPYLDATGKIAGLIGISRDITDRALVESALKETDARLREAQRIARLGSWSWNPQSNEVWWSDAEFEVLCITPGTVCPSFEAFLAQIHPEDRPAAIARVEAMQAGKDSFANDFRIPQADGTCKWIHSQARATRDHHGNIIRVEGTDQDVTAQRLDRESAYKSESRLRAAVEVARLGIIDIDYEKQIAELSPRAAEQFGFAPRTRIPREELHSRFHPADTDQLAKAIDETQMPGGTGLLALEHRVVRPDGTTRWLNVRKQVSFDFEDGRPKGAIVVTADVTEQREAETSLREQEMLVREAAELAKVGGWGFDPVALKSDWTPVVAEMYGLPPESPPPVEKALDYFHLEQRQDLQNALAAAISDGIPHDLELLLIASNGDEKWVRTICRPIVENGRVVRVRGSLQDITDRKKAESELKASEERYRLLFESNPNPMWVYDVHTLKFLAVNDAAVQSYGYAREEFLSMTLRDIRPPDEVPKLELNVASQVPGLSRSAQWKHRRKDGTVFDVEIASHHLPKEHSHARLVIALDITDRKRAEEAREVATQRLSKFASQLPGAIFLYHLGIDEKSTIPYASANIEAILGIRQELLVSDASIAFSKVHAEDRDGLLEAICNSANYLTPLCSEFRVIHDDGTIHWISCDATPEKEPDGSTLWHGYMKEVTTAHEAAIELEEAKSQLEEAQALARIGSWSLDLLADRCQWSKQMYRIFNFESLDTQPSYEVMLSSLVHEDATKLDAAIRKVTNDGEPYSLDVRVGRPQSELRYVRCQGRARRDSVGRIIGLFGTAADVTAEVEREEALKIARNQADAANRAKSQFLANMSHEIRTPLTAIIGFAEVLREDANFAVHSHWMHDLETIARAGKHLQAVINDILDFSKLEADKITLAIVETRLIDVLSEVERLFLPAAAGKGVVLRTVLSTPIPDRVLCDPTRLRQILMNLVGNAVKFTDKGRILVRASVAQKSECAQLVIDVEDTGLGIDAEQSPSLFQAFEQADNTVSRKHGGTGLGLTISRRLAALMGGDVTLEQSELEKGSRFRVSLPIQPIDGTSWVNSIPDRNASNISGTPEDVSIQGNILLAEDGIDNQRLIALFLKKAGATVNIANDGEVAFEMMQKANESNMPYDLLLTDIQMPMMDGYMLTRSLRKQGVTIPIIALTAHALPEDRQRCLDAGCDDYLSKPVDKHSLVALCAKWLLVHRSQGRIS